MYTHLLLHRMYVEGMAPIMLVLLLQLEYPIPTRVPLRPCSGPSNRCHKPALASRYVKQAHAVMRELYLSHGCTEAFAELALLHPQASIRKHALAGSQPISK